MFGLGSQSQLGIGIAVSLHDRFSANAAKVNQTLLNMRRNASSALTGAMANYRDNAAGIAAGAAAVSYGMLNAAKAGAEFQHKVNQIAIVGGKSLNRSRADLSKYAQTLSKEFTRTPTEIAEAVFENAKAGVRDNIEEITRYQIATATAVDEQLSGKGGVAEKLLGITNAMGIATTEFHKVANATTAVSNATMANVYDIGEAMEYAAFTAKSFNIPLEETLAMVGLLSQSKIHGSAAGTALNNYMVMLGKSLGPFATPRSKKAWQMLGLDTNQMTQMLNSGNIMGITAAIQQATTGMDSSSRKGILQALFNMRGMRGIEGLIVNMLDESMTGGRVSANSLLNLTKDAVAKSGTKDDPVLKQSKQMMNDLYSDFKFMANAFSRFKIAFTEAAGPTIRVLMKLGGYGLQVLEALMNNPIGKVLASIAVIAAPLIGIMFAFRAAVMGAIIALNGFRGTSAAGSFWSLAQAGMGAAGAGRMMASGINPAIVTGLKNGSLKFNAAGRIINASTGRFVGLAGGASAATYAGIAAGTAGNAAKGFFSKAGPWLGRVAGFGLKWLPVIGVIWSIYDVLTQIRSEVKQKPKDEVAEFMADYNKNLDAMFIGRTGPDDWYKYNRNPYGTKFNINRKPNQMQQQINLYIDGKKAVSEDIDIEFEDNINKTLNFNFSQ